MARYEKEDFKRNMKLRLNFNNMMAQFVGEKGIKEEEIAALAQSIEAAEQAMIEKRKNGGMDWRDLPYNQEAVVDDILHYVEEVKDQFDAFVVLGIGGSALVLLHCSRQSITPIIMSCPARNAADTPNFM